MPPEVNVTERFDKWKLPKISEFVDQGVANLATRAASSRPYGLSGDSFFGNPLF